VRRAPRQPYYRKSKSKSGMTKVEERFASYLNLLKSVGKIEDWKFEPMSIKIADGVRYNPDFEIVGKEFITMAEIKPGSRDKKTGQVKPFSMDDGYRTKIYVAAEKYPEFRWLLIWDDKNGGWMEREI
jgi:hypothetical protein